jgi:hypothetical protein
MRFKHNIRRGKLMSGEIKELQVCMNFITCTYVSRVDHELLAQTACFEILPESDVTNKDEYRKK